MFLELDGQGPAYAQLIRALKAAILDGRLLANSKLPPTRRFAEELSVSRITVLAAYEQLRAEGYISCKAGSGCRVNALQTEPKLRVPSAEPVAPQSRYMARARPLRERYRAIARQHRGLRFDLQYGNPITNPVLNALWGRELANAAKYTSLEIADSAGLLALREQVCAYVGERRGIRAQPDDVVIVNGTQHAISLTARVLLEEGDPVIVEEPHYFGLWKALAAHGARLCPAPVDDEGLVCAALPRDAPRLVCVTPSHQFPAGPVMSLSRRLELLRYADARQCWILEDDYDSEFRYDSQPLAALRSLDQGNRVIYVGTFSKVLFGSLRLGYVIPPKSLKDDFVEARSLCDVSGPAIEQTALANFMRNGGFGRHLRKMGATLRQRREVLLEELQRCARGRVQVANSHTGMHVVAWLPGYSHAQVSALIEHAHANGLGLYPIARHYHTPPATPGLLLGYCGLSSSELREAMKLFGQCLDAIDAAAGD